MVHIVSCIRFSVHSKLFVFCFFFVNFRQLKKAELQLGIVQQSLEQVLVHVTNTSVINTHQKIQNFLTIIILYIFFIVKQNLIFLFVLLCFRFIVSALAWRSVAVPRARPSSGARGGDRR